MNNHNLTYRTFDQLLADVQNDFSTYHLENMIDPQQLIKVARTINSSLGMRISSTKETILEVEHGRVRLPLNYHSLNFAFICGSYTEKYYMPQGTYIDEIPVGVKYQYVPNEINLCGDPIPPETPICTVCSQNNCGCNPIPTVQLDCKGNQYQLIQKLKYTTRAFEYLRPLKIVNSKTIECDCPNLYITSEFEASIKDGFLYLNVEEAKVYLNYQSLMEDEEGNLLVPDHALINDYYEYALKKRIIENLIMNDETVSQAKIQIIEEGYRRSKNQAFNVVRTPDFQEIHKIWQANRLAQRNRYSNMFKGGLTNYKLLGYNG